MSIDHVCKKTFINASVLFLLIRFSFNLSTEYCLIGAREEFFSVKGDMNDFLNIYGGTIFLQHLKYFYPKVGFVIAIDREICIISISSVLVD